MIIQHIQYNTVLQSLHELEIIEVENKIQLEGSFLLRVSSVDYILMLYTYLLRMADNGNWGYMRLLKHVNYRMLDQNLGLLQVKSIHQQQAAVSGGKSDISPLYTVGTRPAPNGKQTKLEAK